MKIMNRKKLWIATVLLCCGLVVKGQEDNAVVPVSESAVRHEVSLCFEPAPGGKKSLRARTFDGKIVKVGGRYEHVESRILQQLKRRESATYWYEIIPEGYGSHYRVRAHTSSNAIGLGSSYLFYGDFTHFGDWMEPEYKNCFEGAEFGLRDFSVGFLYDRQLFGLNRHRLNLETELSYRRIHQLFSTDRYTTSYPAIDPDNYEYTRLVSVTDYKESVVKNCLTVPLYLRYDLFIFKYLSLFVAGGIDNVFIVSEDADATFDATYAGRYGEELFNTVIDENGYYDFGKYPNNHIITENETAFRYSLYGAARAGIQLFVGPVLSIEASGIYHHMLYSNTPDGNVGPFCLSDAEGHYQSMNNVMKPASKNRLGVNVKLKINF